MTGLLLLCRHGNTFEAGEPAYMVGAHQDLPLTREGEAQARLLGDVLARYELPATQIICAPLKRTQRYAEIVLSYIDRHTEVKIDPRLVELDYGGWTGKTSEEITALYGPEEIGAWNERGRWPTSVEFLPDKADVLQDASDVLAESATFSGLTIVVTSNGRIRAFSQVAGIDQIATLGGKMKTGCCALLHQQQLGWHSLGWNVTPTQLSSIVTTTSYLKSKTE